MKVITIAGRSTKECEVRKNDRGRILQPFLSRLMMVTEIKKEQSILTSTSGEPKACPISRKVNRLCYW